MRTASIREVAQVVRRKYAGPFRLTLDVLFTDRAVYEQVKKSGEITGAAIAGLRKLPEDRAADFVWFDPGKAVNATLIRPVRSASPLGRDIYGAQQHAPLLGPTITLPDAP